MTASYHPDMKAITLLSALLLCLCSQALASAPSLMAGRTPVIPCEIVNSFPHDPEAFTQGLFLYNGQFLESTGQYGRSTLRTVEVETGRVLKRTKIGENFFAEGADHYGERLYMLTWKARTGLIFNIRTHEQLGSFTYETEGWGLACDEKRLVMSDGTARLQFLDPETLTPRGSILVRDAGVPVTRINELELVKGFLLCNIWKSDRIAVVDLDSGLVKAWLDISNLRPELAYGSGAANGMAYDEENDRLLVTGKNWDRVFEIKPDKIPWRE